MAHESEKVTISYSPPVYWEFTRSDGSTKQVFQRESALIELLAAEVVFLSSGYPEFNTCELVVNCNDLFYWASADAEPFNYDEVEALYLAYRDRGYHGVSRWCCLHRGLRPQAPIEAMWRKQELWDVELENLPKPEDS